MENMKVNNLFNLENTIAKEYLEQFEYPYEALKGIKQYVIELQKALSSDRYIIKDDVYISKTANVSEHAVILGPTIIEDEAEIRPFAYIRGSVIIGKNAIVGNSSEVKNSILFNCACVPHFNYVGDSILGYKSHLGAGAKTSNFKSDGTNISIKYEDRKIETNLRKMGAILGDNVEVGCNSILNPGTVIGKNTNIYPMSCVRGYVTENAIYKSESNVVSKR